MNCHYLKIAQGASSGIIQHVADTKNYNESDFTKGGWVGNTFWVYWMSFCLLSPSAGYNQQATATNTRCLRERARQSAKEECERGEKVNEKDDNLKMKRGNKTISEEYSSGSRSNILTCVIEVNRKHQAHQNLLMRTVQHS